MHSESMHAYIRLQFLIFISFYTCDMFCFILNKNTIIEHICLLIIHLFCFVFFMIFQVSYCSTFCFCLNSAGR